MDNNLKRHRLLKILAGKYIKVNLKEENALGVSYEDLRDKLNCGQGELLELGFALREEEEIDFHDAHNIKGFYCKEKGIASFNTKKYVRLNEKLIFDRVKNLVQTLIPILSLVITIGVITISEIRLNAKQDEIERIENRLKEIELIIIHNEQQSIQTDAPENDLSQN
ncbi:MAG: hypothetical protein KF687_14630 [Cyclobacteriaceae bacterium]|nr:hypothetical protein [Cyclobacteriaceae bacterium]